MTDELREAAHRLLQYPHTVEDTSGGRGEVRCMFCYEPFARCAGDCPWLGLQDAFDAALADSATADAPLEPTEEMYGVVEELYGIAKGYLPNPDMGALTPNERSDAARIEELLRKALAAAQPDTPGEG